MQIGEVLRAGDKLERFSRVNGVSYQHNTSRKHAMQRQLEPESENQEVRIEHWDTRNRTQRKRHEAGETNYCRGR